MARATRRPTFCSTFSGVRNDWRAVLEWYQVPTFHAKVFFNRRSYSRTTPFAGWSDSRATSFIRDLVRVGLGKYNLGARAVAIDVQAFMACTKHERDYLTGGSGTDGRQRFTGASTQPYYMGLTTLLAWATQTLNENDGLQVIHEQQNVLERHSRQLFRHLRNRHAVLQSCSDFTSNDKAPPLQIADLLAYCAFHVAPRFHSHLPRATPFVPPELEVAVRALDRCSPWAVFDAARIASSLESFPEDLRKGRAPD